MPNFWEVAPWNDLRGRPAVVLGNSPAVSEVDLAPLAPIFTVGVNRILRNCTPTAVLAVDDAVMIEEEENFRLFHDQGRLLLFWSDLPARLPAQFADNKFPNAHFFGLKARHKAGEETKLSPLQEGVPKIGNTAGYAVYILAALGASPIGLIGVDYNATALKQNGKHTHCFGATPARGATGGRFGGNQKNFFESIPAQARARGIELFNLSPYDDSIFTKESGWPRLSLAAFCDKAAPSYAR